MVDLCFTAVDSQNVWESVPFLGVWQGRHSSNWPTTTDDGHHCWWSAQACSRWVRTSCSSSSYWSPAFAQLLDSISDNMGGAAIGHKLNRNMNSQLWDFGILGFCFFVSLFLTSVFKKVLSCIFFVVFEFSFSYGVFVTKTYTNLCIRHGVDTSTHWRRERTRLQTRIQNLL